MIISKMTSDCVLCTRNRELCQMDDCHFSVCRSKRNMAGSDCWRHQLNIHLTHQCKKKSNGVKMAIVCRNTMSLAIYITSVCKCMSHSCENIIVHWTNFTIANMQNASPLWPIEICIHFSFFSLSLKSNYFRYTFFSFKQACWHLIKRRRRRRKTKLMSIWYV
jgi:hypothetical protein